MCTSTPLKKLNPAKRYYKNSYYNFFLTGCSGRGCRFHGEYSILSAIQTHAGALVQVHVGIAKETFGHTLHVSRHLTGQFSGRHIQVGPNFGAGVDLWDVEAVNFSWTQCTAEPVEHGTNVRKWKRATHLLCLPCCQRRSSLRCLGHVWWRRHNGWSRCRAQQTAPVFLWLEHMASHDPCNLQGRPEKLADGTGVEDERAPRVGEKPCSFSWLLMIILIRIFSYSQEKMLGITYLEVLYIILIYSMYLVKT